MKILVINNHSKDIVVLLTAIFEIHTCPHSYDPIRPYSSASQLQNIIVRRGRQPIRETNLLRSRTTIYLLKPYYQEISKESILVKDVIIESRFYPP